MGPNREGRHMKPNNQISDDIDHATSRSICDEVAQRLRQDLRFEASLPPYLDRLISELRKRDKV